VLILQAEIASPAIILSSCCFVGMDELFWISIERSARERGLGVEARIRKKKWDARCCSMSYFIGILKSGVRATSDQDSTSFASSKQRPTVSRTK